MSLPDAINASFELGGAMAQGLNVAALMRDRRVAGVSWAATAFFTGWGVWNLFYYPHLGQPASFAAGVCLVCTNAAWLALVVRYRPRP